MRLHLPQRGGAFAGVAHAIADADALLGAIDLVRVESHEVVRDVTVACVDSDHAEAVVAESVAEAVAGAAVDSGVARRERAVRGHEPTTPLEAMR